MSPKAVSRSEKLSYPGKKGAFEQPPAVLCSSELVASGSFTEIVGPERQQILDVFLQLLNQTLSADTPDEFLAQSSFSPEEVRLRAANLRVALRVLQASSPQAIHDALGIDPGSEHSVQGVYIQESERQEPILVYVEQPDREQTESIVRHELGHMVQDAYGLYDESAYDFSSYWQEYRRVIAKGVLLPLFFLLVHLVRSDALQIKDELTEILTLLLSVGAVSQLLHTATHIHSQGKNRLSLEGLYQVDRRERSADELALSLSR